MYDVFYRQCYTDACVAHWWKKISPWKLSSFAFIERLAISSMLADLFVLCVLAFVLYKFSFFFFYSLYGRYGRDGSTTLHLNQTHKAHGSRLKAIAGNSMHNIQHRMELNYRQPNQTGEIIWNERIFMKERTTKNNKARKKISGKRWRDELKLEEEERERNKANNNNNATRDEITHKKIIHALL